MVVSFPIRAHMNLFLWKCCIVYIFNTLWNVKKVYYPEHKAPWGSHTLLNPVVLIHCFASSVLSTASEAQPAQIYGKKNNSLKKIGGINNEGRGERKCSCSPHWEDKWWDTLKRKKKIPIAIVFPSISIRKITLKKFKDHKAWRERGIDLGYKMGLSYNITSYRFFSYWKA